MEPARITWKRGNASFRRCRRSRDSRGKNREREKKRRRKKGEREREKKSQSIDFGNVALSILDARPFSPYIDESGAHALPRVALLYYKCTLLCKQAPCVPAFKPRHTHIHTHARALRPSYVTNDLFSSRILLVRSKTLSRRERHKSACPTTLPGKSSILLFLFLSSIAFFPSHRSTCKIGVGGSDVAAR